ncbi:cytochrome c biogenesis heme-transporting ATPase CcmA [Thiomicrorhabdus sp. Kp2]|uniref:cytochrome c biogenesis heme-transporting ATPase CcmA n=1 Tax=Thiomicrorhabdus sp. Kp2 TaxID=1123518 RepID=UPI0005929DE2|nr:cytochrome c biogenesis heme-transporting ATPase CcmA [Thiomicrorhabdus sp. Kp2]
MRLTANQLSCIRSHKTLFKNISFELSSGQLLLVEGKNGAGKTSLLKLLTGLRRPDKGQVLWNNIDILKPESAFHSQLAWIGHQNPLKEEQTALENLELLSHLKSRNNLPLIKALKAVHLGQSKHILVKTFSAGMKRRLSLACLLITDAPLWILDEPQASLDREGVQLFEELAETHLNMGGMIILTSHHPLSIAEERVQKLQLGITGELK